MLVLCQMCPISSRARFKRWACSTLNAFSILSRYQFRPVQCISLVPDGGAYLNPGAKRTTCDHTLFRFLLRTGPSGLAREVAVRTTTILASNSNVSPRFSLSPLRNVHAAKHCTVECCGCTYSPCCDRTTPENNCQQKHLVLQASGPARNSPNLIFIMSVEIAHIRTPRTKDGRTP